jgi:prevent-host-death family protein
MQILTTTQARGRLSELVNRVRFKNEPIAIGRRNTPEVLLIRYPQYRNPSLSEETNVNANSDSFAFLEHEPELYSLDDLKRRYV